MVYGFLKNIFGLPTLMHPMFLMYLMHPMRPMFLMYLRN